MMFYLVLLFTLVTAKKKYNVVVMPDADNSVLGVLGRDDLVLKTTRVGYTLELSDRTAKKLKKHPKIKYFEEDAPIHMAEFITVENPSIFTLFQEKSSIIRLLGEKPPAITFNLQKNTTWGLSRISGHVDSYEYIEDGGKDVIVYIMDSGVDDKNPEFEGRAEMKYNAVEGSPMIDEHGHGTHCAGTIASRSFGVAKAAKIVGVKILDKHGFGAVSLLMTGIDYVIEDYLERIDKYDRGESEFTRIPRAVVNMSIGGTKSQVLNHIIERAMHNYGIHFSTAAGNDSKDACAFSPSSSVSLTVGASTRKNDIASFSNRGSCVDLYAPGVGIESTWLDNKTKVASGTSMAAPHVSGMMAVYLGLADFTPSELKKRIKMDAENVIVGSSVRKAFRAKNGLASLISLYDRLKQAGLGKLVH